MRRLRNNTLVGPGRARWRRGATQVPLRDGSALRVTGWVIGGLIVHRATGGRGHHVTHMGSGKIILPAPGRGTMGDARLAAERLNRIFDWTQGESAIREAALFLAPTARALWGDPGAGIQ